MMFDPVDAVLDHAASLLEGVYFHGALTAAILPTGKLSLMSTDGTDDCAGAVAILPELSAFITDTPHVHAGLTAITPANMYLRIGPGYMVIDQELEHYDPAECYSALGARSFPHPDARSLPEIDDVLHGLAAKMLPGTSLTVWDDGTAHERLGFMHQAPGISVLAGTLQERGLAHNIVLHHPGCRPPLKLSRFSNIALLSEKYNDLFWIRV